MFDWIAYIEWRQTASFLNWYAEFSTMNSKHSKPINFPPASLTISQNKPNGSAREQNKNKKTSTDEQTNRPKHYDFVEDSKIIFFSIQSHNMQISTIKWNTATTLLRNRFTIVEFSLPLILCILNGNSINSDVTVLSIYIAIFVVVVVFQFALFQHVFLFCSDGMCSVNRLITICLMLMVIFQSVLTFIP